MYVLLKYKFFFKSYVMSVWLLPYAPLPSNDFLGLPMSLDEIGSQ